MSDQHTTLSAHISDSHKLRIVTFNVCGIRNVLQYKPWNEGKTFREMFDKLNADIVCFQETKIQRSDVTRDMADIPGFDSYFTFSHHKKGYSGVAVYCRQASCHVVAAEEGITGILTPPGGQSKTSTLSYRDCPRNIGGYDFSLSTDEARLLDSEGRSLVIDFGLFVLIGVYCPAAASTERQGYRRQYIKVLFERVRNLVGLGTREVVLLGDLNIIRDQLDTADRLQRSDEDDFDAPQRLLHELLYPNKNGILVDICRELHPERSAMYTCWNQKLNARPANYGARLDYICITPGLKERCIDADIRPDLLGSDHCPVFIDMLVESRNNQDDPNLLKLESRNLFGFARAQTVTDMFAKKSCSNSVSISSKRNFDQSNPGQTSDLSLASISAVGRCNPSESQDRNKMKRARKIKAVQQKLTRFVSSPAGVSAELTEHQDSGFDKSSQSDADIDQAYFQTSKNPSTELWKDVFRKPQPPMCNMHTEPCVLRITRKSGVNEGRAFWMCARPVGPGHQRSASLPEDVNRDYKCNFFKWASESNGRSK
ncbi:DNase I-like protein [Limtongia smithiae]|uniref:DNase I-like protein n=1 Tax=Limtongia smithiae TaxID=1125753 RepID=UPI0034CF45A5